MTDPKVQEQIDRLKSRRADLAAHLDECAVVDDVLNNRVLSKTVSKGHVSYTLTNPNSTPDPSLNPVMIDANPAVHANDRRYQECQYLPKGHAEPPSEYRQRIAMTPWFPETPKVVSDRMGAIFQNEPDVVYADSMPSEDKALADLWQRRCTADGKPLMSLIVRAAELVQRHGYCGILFDHMPLPDGKTAENVSVEEQMSQGIGMPILAIYDAPKILSWQSDASGLLWVKLYECDTVQDTWNGSPVQVETIRIVDRQGIEVHEIRSTDDGATISTKPIVPHEQELQGKCPFVIVADMVGDDGLGHSTLKPVAEADIAATRLLSDIVWDLFIVGQPILLFQTGRSDEELPKLNFGASRYIPIRNSSGAGMEPEDMRYLQLDPTGIQFQMAVREQILALGKAHAGKDSALGMPQARESSGISKAWSFKSGEERMLFVLTRSLEYGFDSILELYCTCMGLDPKMVTIKFSDDFDLVQADDRLKNEKELLALADQYNIPTAKRAYLRQILTSDDGLTEEDIPAIEAEIEDMDETEEPDEQDGNAIKSGDGSDMSDKAEEEQDAGDENQQE